MHTESNSSDHSFMPKSGSNSLNFANVSFHLGQQGLKLYKATLDVTDNVCRHRTCSIKASYIDGNKEYYYAEVIRKT